MRLIIYIPIFMTFLFKEIDSAVSLTEISLYKME